MAFHGCEFIFDNIPCTEYGLELYNFGSNSQDDVSFPSVGEVSEDRINSRYDALMYGLTQNQPLEYTLVFGANMASITANESVDRYEVEAIAAWLTGHNQRKWLTIVMSKLSRLDLLYFSSKPEHARGFLSILKNFAFQARFLAFFRGFHAKLIDISAFFLYIHIVVCKNIFIF